LRENLKYGLKWQEMVTGMAVIEPTINAAIS